MAEEHHEEHHEEHTHTEDEHEHDSDSHELGEHEAEIRHHREELNAHREYIEQHARVHEVLNEEIGRLTNLMTEIPAQIVAASEATLTAVREELNKTAEAATSLTTLPPSGTEEQSEMKHHSNRHHGTLHPLNFV